MPQYVRIVGLNLLQRKVDKFAQDMVVDMLQDLYENLMDEAPEKTGRLKDSIEVEGVTSISRGYHGKIHIGKNNKDVGSYVWKVIKGSAEDDSIHLGHPTMHFKDWENGPEDLRGKDGYFHFKKVSHDIEPNDFVTRAIEKFKTKINTIAKASFESTMK